MSFEKINNFEIKSAFSKEEIKFKDNTKEDIMLSDLKSRKYFSLEEIVQYTHMNDLLFNYFPNQAKTNNNFNFHTTKENSIQKLPNLSRYTENKYYSDKLPTICFSLKNYQKKLITQEFNAILLSLENDFDNIINFIEKEKNLHKKGFYNKSQSFDDLLKRIKYLYNGNYIGTQTFFNFMKIFDFLDDKRKYYEISLRKSSIYFNNLETFYKDKNNAFRFTDNSEGNYNLYI
jgi:hypothetical protein